MNWNRYKFILAVVMLPLHVIKLSLYQFLFIVVCVPYWLVSITAGWKHLLLPAKWTKTDDSFIAAVQVVNKYGSRATCLKGQRSIDTFLHFIYFIHLFPGREQYDSKLMRKKTKALYDFACIWKSCYKINSILIDVHFHVIAKLKYFNTSVHCRVQIYIILK